MSTALYSAVWSIVAGLWIIRDSLTGAPCEPIPVPRHSAIWDRDLDG